MSLALPESPAPSRARKPPADTTPVIDVALLNADIDRIALTHAKSSDMMRQAVVERLRGALDIGLRKARAWLDADAKGLDCAERISRLQDDVIRAAHRFVTLRLYPAQNPSSAERLAVAAVGGYGRGTLAPGSDIDLLFLLPYKQTAWSESVIEAILYILWDLRQKVGHATRSVDECLRQARQDMTIRTSLLEARLILGDEALFSDMRARFQKEIVVKTAREFVAAKLAERDQRVRRAGNSRYLVEPNVKESKGGLRDLNTLFWIAKYVYRVSDVSELVGAGLFTAPELRLFLRCEEFLWRVRCHMHFFTERAEDRLSFDLQPAIATRLGYVKRAGMSDVERFMKHYFLIAKDVGDLTAIVCAALEERQAKPRAALNRFIDGLRGRGNKLKADGFANEYGRINTTRADIFERDPVNLIRLFWLAHEHGLAIHPDATRLATRSLRKIDARLRANPVANKLVLDLLTSRKSPETILRLMNEAGVLGRFIPDFGRIVAMMQFNMYHHYTVDEHLLQSMGILSAIENGSIAGEHPLAYKVISVISNRAALHVALFLHDIAKGREEDHSIAGARVARELCPRLGLSAGETDTVSWLIEQHLVMSNTAHSRDLADPRTIQKFANIVQTLERLRLLLVLTVCDIRAVGPGVWNGWKGQLLRTLYWETEVVITGGHSAINRNARVDASQRELRAALATWSDPDFEAYAARHYPAYWLRTNVQQRVAHAQLLRLADVEVKSLLTEYTTDSFRGVTELTVVAPDHPRLLSTIAGACAAAGANIADAQISTTTDGLALDTIWINRGFERDEDELRRAARVAETIEKALRGQIRLADVVEARGRDATHGPRAFVVAPETLIDNNLSNHYTVIEVAGLDRTGLLYELTAALSALNLNIGSAHIATFGEKAVDSFYVTDLTGGKIVSTQRQGVIKDKMIEIMSPGAAAAKSKRARGQS